MIQALQRFEETLPNDLPPISPTLAQTAKHALILKNIRSK